MTFWPLCRTAGIVHLADGHYYLPNESSRGFEDRFTNLGDLQRHLTTKGIPNLDRLSCDEQEKSIHWVKYANVPHRTGATRPEEIRLTTVPEVQSIAHREMEIPTAWSLW
jgi:hypothetical protein